MKNKKDINLAHFLFMKITKILKCYNNKCEILKDFFKSLENISSLNSMQKIIIKISIITAFSEHVAGAPRRDDDI